MVCISNERYLTIDGITKSIHDWALEYNIKPNTITTRLKSGIPDKEAVTKPVRVNLNKCNLDYTGKVFNSWKVLHRGNKKNYWYCKCTSCGKEKDVYIYNLIGNKTKTCGCYRIDHPNNISHGMSNTRFYGIWCGMKGRCYDKNIPKYKNYGERGIIICDRWKNSFENFKEDMYDSYLSHVKEFGESNTSIDRIDVDGNYEPSNCKWSTVKEQGNNTTTNHYIEYKGVTYTLMELSEKIGMNYGTFKSRISDYGWSVDDAVETPVRESNK